MTASKWRRTRRAGRWKRTEELRLALRPGELADLREIAAGWGCPLSTAGWVILHDALRRARRSERQYGEAGIAIAAGLAVRLAKLPPVPPPPDPGDGPP